MTNGDKIRNMSDEELAELLTNKDNGYEYIKKLAWLKSEEDNT